MLYLITKKSLLLENNKKATKVIVAYFSYNLYILSHQILPFPSSFPAINTHQILYFFHT